MGKKYARLGAYNVCPLCGTRSMYRFYAGDTQGYRYRCMNPVHKIRAAKAKRWSQKKRRRRERRNK